MDTSKLRYTETHEWVQLEGSRARVGISDHAQKEISDVVFVELPKAGRQVKARESVMVLESVKAAFDIYAPLSGKIAAVNEALTQKPELVNQSPYEKGWLYTMDCSDPAEFGKLLTEEQYKQVQSSSH
jgi:glycine cleavage system H protein